MHLRHLRRRCIDYDKFVLLLCKTFALLTNEVEVVEIVDAHGVAYLVHGLCGCFACLLGAFLQYFVYARYVLLPLVTTLAHGLKHVVDNVVQELLTLHVAQTATAVVVFQLVEVLIFGPELGKVGIGREGVPCTLDFLMDEINVVFNTTEG